MESVKQKKIPDEVKITGKDLKEAVEMSERCSIIIRLTKSRQTSGKIEVKRSYKDVGN